MADTQDNQANQDWQARDAQDGRQELEMRLNLAVQRQGNRTVLFTHGIAQRIGLSATEFECYSLLLEQGPMTAGQLGAACGLSSGGVTGLINRLLRQGFVTRERDPKDRRRVIITGVQNQVVHQKLLALYAPVGQGFDEMMTHYSDAQLKTLLDFMQRADDMIVGVLGQMRGIDEE
jgi:DNA-binding MarR family transcriptional regulator